MATKDNRDRMVSTYSLTGKWDDHVEFEYLRYYATKLDDAIEIDGRKRCTKRYAYELPDGRWLCGIRPRERDCDKEPLRDPVWLDAPDFERVTALPGSSDADGWTGHCYRSYIDGHLYRVVDTFYFGSPGYDAVIEPVEIDESRDHRDARFRWVSARAIGASYHHSRKCPCVAHLPYAYGAR